MAYVIKKNAGIWWPVRWDESVDGGNVETAEISVKFRRLSVSQVADLNKKLQSGEMKDAEFVALVVLDWIGPTDDDKPLLFTPDNLAMMMEIPGFAAGLGIAFWNMAMREADERSKNSNGSPAAGPGAVEPTADQPPGKPI